MEEWTCGKCGAENKAPKEFPFGDDVVCSECGAVNTTDWDYVGEDSMAWWIEGLKKDKL